MCRREKAAYSVSRPGADGIRGVSWGLRIPVDVWPRLSYEGFYVTRQRANRLLVSKLFRHTIQFL